MTSALGPTLGRLAAPPSGARWEGIRLDLLDALLADPTPEGWLTAWEAAMAALRDAVLAEAREALEAAAGHARYPEARLRTLLPDAEQADILWQRLLAEGMAVERLGAAGASPEAMRARAAALEAAWDGAVGVATAERQRWASLAARVAAWRRPWWPVLTVGGVLLLLTAVVSAWLGGQLPAPAWFTPVAQWFWGLPWP